MSRRSRVGTLLMLLAVVIAIRLGQQAYRWYAFSEERDRLSMLRGGLEVAGVEIVRTQLRADSLREQIERMDRELEVARRAVDAYGRRAVDGALPGHLYDAYRAELDAYNRRVGDRNARLEEWRSAIERNHRMVDRYNALADSIRALAEGIGEPYYSIPTPAELAVERGIVPGER